MSVPQGPYPPQGGHGMPWPPPGPVERPRAVATASVLWVLLGVLLVLGAVGYSGTAAGTGARLSPLALMVVMAIGVLFMLLAGAMRLGSDGARIALTVLGSLFLLMIWPVLLVVPALVLQFRSRSSAWFAAVKAGRAG